MFVSKCRRDGKEDPPLFRFASIPKATNYGCPPRHQVAKMSDKLYYNIMTDPRVRRGSYAVDLGPKIIEEPYYPCFEMVKKDPLCHLYLRGLKKCSVDSAGTKDIKPMPKHKTSKAQKEIQQKVQGQLVGKNNSECQTDLFFEMLSEGIIKAETSIQTEPESDINYKLLGRIMLKNPKVGDDKESQILPGELFHFDKEIAPIVINCTSIVIEQALLELMMESELEALLAQQRAFEAKRNLELLRLQRLQKRQQDIVNENARQIQAEKDSMEKAREAGEMVSLALFAKHFLTDILEAAMDSARKDGFMISENEIGRDAETIMTWIEKKTDKAHKKNIISREILDDIIGYALYKTRYVSAYIDILGDDYFYMDNME